jgi:hypothetical protein
MPWSGRSQTICSGVRVSHLGAEVGQQRIQTQLNRLAQPCIQALSGEDGLKFWPSNEKQGWGVWGYRRGGYLLLLQVVDGANAHTVESACRRSRT